MRVKLLGMKFATGEKATCIKSHPLGYLKVGKEYDIKGNNGVLDEEPNEITDAILIHKSELEHQNDLADYEDEKGNVAFSTEYFSPEDNNVPIVIV